MNLRGSGGTQKELRGYENDVIIVLISEILKNKTITKNKVEKEFKLYYGFLEFKFWPMS